MNYLLSTKIEQTKNNNIFIKEPLLQSSRTMIPPWDWSWAKTISMWMQHSLVDSTQNIGTEPAQK